MTNQKCATVSLTLSTRSCWEGAMENIIPKHAGTFSLKNEWFFRLSGHASPAQHKLDSNWSCHSRVTALQNVVETDRFSALHLNVTYTLQINSWKYLRSPDHCTRLHVSSYSNYQHLFARKPYLHKGGCF